MEVLVTSSNMENRKTGAIYLFIALVESSNLYANDFPY